MANHFILTYTKTKFSPLAPKMEDIRLEDIAHALPRIARANGHFRDFYSVGQHCLDCAQEALARGCTAREALACLLHDGAEAYLSDLVSPVKKQLREYVAVEDRLLDMIYAKFLPGELTPREKRLVKEIDNGLLYGEFMHFMDEPLADEPPYMATKPAYQFTSFALMEQQYLAMVQELTDRMEQEESRTHCQCVGITCYDQQWLAVIIDGTQLRAERYAQLAQLCHCYRDADTVFINLPVGLPQTAEEAQWRPEQQWRRYASRYTDNLYSAPCRQAVYAADQKEALAENRRILQRMMAPQALAMLAQIRETDEFLSNHTDWKNVLRESHPELLAEKTYQQFSKLYQDEIAILQQAFIEKNGQGKKRYLQDGLALAVLGWQEWRYGSRTVPAEPHYDARGLHMQAVLACQDE